MLQYNIILYSILPLYEGQTEMICPSPYLNVKYFPIFKCIASVEKKIMNHSKSVKYNIQYTYQMDYLLCLLFALGRKKSIACRTAS